MTDTDRVAAIRARAEALVTFPGNAEVIIKGIDAFRLAREDVPFLLAEVERLTHLLGSHADGHLCTCTMLAAQTPWEPSEWEQDPWCPTHPNMTIVADEVERLRAEVESLRTLRMEIDQGFGGPATIKVWRDNVLRFNGVDLSALMERDASRSAHAAEAAKFQAETLTTSFLMGRIRRRVEEFDRSALTCDRCGWRGARVVHVDGDLRELRCGHEKCAVIDLQTSDGEVQPEACPTASGASPSEPDDPHGACSRNLVAVAVERDKARASAAAASERHEDDVRRLLDAARHVGCDSDCDYCYAMSELTRERDAARDLLAAHEAEVGERIAQDIDAAWREAHAADRNDGGYLDGYLDGLEHAEDIVRTMLANPTTTEADA